MALVDNKSPDLFAASLLVAGQGDAQEMLAVIHEKRWIIVSAGDFRAFPGMSASVIGAADLAGVRARKDLLDARFHAHECVVVSARRTSRRLLELTVRGYVQRR
jgi:predicted peptidase